MAFSDEGDFERALITVLFDKGWSREVIQYPTEKDLIRNWADKDLWGQAHFGRV